MAEEDDTDWGDASSAASSEDIPGGADFFSTFADPVPTLRSRPAPVFLFVNAAAGEGKASALTDIPVGARSRVPSVRGQALHIYDLHEGAPGQKPGFRDLADEVECLEDGQTVTVVACAWLFTGVQIRCASLIDREIRCNRNVEQTTMAMQNRIRRTI